MAGGWRSSRRLPVESVVVGREAVHHQVLDHDEVVQDVLPGDLQEADQPHLISLPGDRLGALDAGADRGLQHLPHGAGVNQPEDTLCKTAPYCRGRQHQLAPYRPDEHASSPDLSKEGVMMDLPGAGSYLKHLVLPPLGPPRRDEAALLLAVHHATVDLFLALDDPDHRHQHDGVPADRHHGPLQHHPQLLGQLVRQALHLDAEAHLQPALPVVARRAAS